MPNRGDHAADPTPLRPAVEQSDAAGPRPLADPRRERLEALAARVNAAAQLRARVVSPSRSGTGTGTTTVHVVNPAAAHLAEDIGCDLIEGAWWFTWPLNNSGTLGPADDLDGAVRVITHVLSARK